jgi:hypothetical protein
VSEGNIMALLHVSTALLRSLIGRALVGARRQVFLSDYLSLSEEVRDQESDGSLELNVDDGRVVTFLPETNMATIILSDTEEGFGGSSYTCIDPSTNAFWRQRLGKPIVEIILLYDDGSELELDLPVGLAFVFDDALFTIEYISNKTHCDQMIILPFIEDSLQTISIR